MSIHDASIVVVDELFRGCLGGCGGLIIGELFDGK
jgi:hypothetical protein